VTIRVGLEHRTTYSFDRLVDIGPHVVRLRPAPHCRTPITAYALRVTPADHFINWQQDPFGNHLARLVFPERATELSIVVDLVADLTVINPFDFFVEDSASTYPFRYDPMLAADLEPYLRAVGTDDGSVRAWVAGHVGENVPIVDFLVALNQALRDDVDYTVRLETGVQSPEETLRLRLGSCRDSAWLLVAVLRELGLAARFVSGYLVQLTPDTGATEALSQDFTDLHAWAEVYIPGAGWVGLDPTSGLFAGEGHIPLSATPHPSSSAPITGTTGPAVVTMDFANIVRRIHEDPRVTRPYTPEQWERIDLLGREVDALLVAGDVRLTMGGEPTYVSADDMEAPEWTIAADGEDKRRLASALAKRLRSRWATGGLVHRGQGKWYPGEPLPRWQIGLLWRADGVSMWSDQSLLDDPWAEGSAKPAQAAEVAAAIVDALGAPAACCLPAYEDALALLLEEARLPLGPPPVGDVDPADRRMRAHNARLAVVERLDDAAGEPAGWVLPLHRTSDGSRWATTRWRLRRGRLVLVPGTSPLGLRLPLGSIAWEPPPGIPERAAFEQLPALAGSMALLPGLPTVEVAVEDAPTTALTVEEREGHVFVFLPPLEHLEDALELLAAVEFAAARVHCPVVIEGYPPPVDPRLRTLVVTPDPGVVEVNVQPSGSWPELVHIVASVDEDARLERLATETFALDGGHAGTGGGNHLTLGGATPADSPLLRRPDLLVSLLTFWQHHPSLSYLFSGRFIGPTSQAPRVDEGRTETLYELEIAFAELARLGDDVRPWHVDRMLRHLLTDITGNTHRAEFCIDKLFSPDSERGRLGLLELRGFEMPPHPQMALVQALLVRSLVARLWDKPYAGPLIRWGPELHDRFLLPDPAAADIGDVVDDLRAHGFAFELSWLEPFLEFRFPRLGHVHVAGVDLELRSAVEPWHVLGEEIATGGTARYVDSSVERLQVSAEGLVPARHVLTCNGVPVPLRPSRPGRTVAGVRFRAWQPASALHPTIKVHSPLVFDLVDRINGRSLGGCTYHVVHPGGRAYETFPVNANEAEARRSRRFETSGHTPGPIDIARIVELEARQARDGADHLRTLDLRRTPPA
jgi:uncharacterized protein (DUF2126 family)/transglutaminase-like putative cysteine protease